jgi:hypothetical protein
MENSPTFEQELRQNLHPGEFIQAHADSVRNHYKLVLTDRRLLVFQRGTILEAFALSALHGETVNVSTGLFFVHIRFQTPRSKHESKIRKGTAASAIAGAIARAAGPSGLTRGRAAAFDRARRAYGSVAAAALLGFAVLAFLQANRSGYVEGGAALLGGCAAIAAGWLPRRRRAGSLLTA